MLAKVDSMVLVGIDAIPCEVEVDVAAGGFDGRSTIVGLPDAAVKESLDRVRTALTNSGFAVPMKDVVVNLAPADIRKEGPAYDLPIAIGLLIGGAQMRAAVPGRYCIAGELALDGRVRPIKGALAMAMMAAHEQLAGVIVPQDNAAEAAVVEGIEVISVGHLSQAVSFLAGELNFEPYHVDLEQVFAERSRYTEDFADVRGQESAKRALTVAAAGHHNLLMIGPPGSGKTMLARRLPSILPGLTAAESLETTRIYSALGLLAPGESLVATRPFRTPHHSTSSPALIGGGSVPKPGEVSLAHHGVLFLDEFPEFNRNTLEMLRQPLEDGKVTIARVHSALTFPAQFMIVAAMNPCPCGYYGHPQKACRCSPNQIQNYLGKISGPLADRIDIHIDVPAVPYRELRGRADGASSEQMRGAVGSAREIQRRRFGANSAMTNAKMTSRQVRQFCELDAAGEQLLKQAMTELGLSARAHDKILRLSRTLADLEGVERITQDHVSEAIQYRRLDRRT